MLSSDESLAFSMSIFEDGKVMSENGVNATIRFSGDADEHYQFKDGLDNLQYIYEKCYENARGWISSTDYEAQCLLFAKLYKHHFVEINADMLKANRERIEKEIARLQKELLNEEVLPDVYFDAPIQDEINKYNKWLRSERAKRSDMHEGSESYLRSTKTIEGYEAKISKLQSYLEQTESA